MHHARTHYVHIVCTSGHLLWRCSRRPITYSTLISTHVNLHQSSHSACYCYGIHIISWQDKWAKKKKQKQKGKQQLWFEPAVAPRQVPFSPDLPALPFKSYQLTEEEKGHQADSWLARMLWFFTRCRSTPEATPYVYCLQHAACHTKKSSTASEHWTR